MFDEDLPPCVQCNDQNVLDDATKYWAGCGHVFCASCKGRLRTSDLCPECKKKLQRFSTKSPEEEEWEQEDRARNTVSAAYRRTRDMFPSEEAYNRYLEDFEELAAKKKANERLKREQSQHRELQEQGTDSLRAEIDARRAEAERYKVHLDSVRDSFAAIDRRRLELKKRKIVLSRKSIGGMVLTPAEKIELIEIDKELASIEGTEDHAHDTALSAGRGSEADQLLCEKRVDQLAGGYDEGHFHSSVLADAFATLSV